MPRKPKTEKPKTEKPRHEYKTKHDRYLEHLAKIDAELPPVDVGQFEGITPPQNGSVPAERVLALANRIMQGISIKDACVLANVHFNSYKRWLSMLKQYESGELDKMHPYLVACAMTMLRAKAIRHLKWQQLAEAGGKGSSTALWMLERRGGAEYRAPAQRHEVKRETTEVIVHKSLEDALESTASQLGISADKLREQGDFWAKAITASQRGNALPAPPAESENE